MTVTWLAATVSLAAQSSRHVILVTIDGLRPEFYLDPKYPAPNLHWLVQHGSHAEQVTPVFPAVTYPNHTSIITGVTPDKHGIYNNEPVGGKGEWFWWADSIKVPTLFDAVRKAGMTSAAVLWPVQVGAQIDYNVPDIWRLKTYDRTKPIEENIRPQSLWKEIQDYATGRLTTDDLNEEKFSLDENTTRIASYLIRQYKPNLLALHLINVDDQQHNHGREADSVNLAIANADHCVGQLLEAIDRAGIRDSTTLIVTGDHGFMDIHTTIFPNVWLKHASVADRFYSGRGSAFYRGDADTVKKILQGLPDSTRSYFSVIEREQLDRLGVYSDVTIAIVPLDDVSVGVSDSGNAIRPALQKGTHGYLPSNPKMKTGFVAYGAGIEKGKLVREMKLTELAVMIAGLLRIKF